MRLPVEAVGVCGEHAHLRHLAPLMLGAAVGVFAVFSTAAQAQAEAGGEGQLAEIIVTAQKREQSLQDVPVAVTALTSAALTANRVTAVQDLNGLVPNLTVRPSAGGIGVPTFTMRGVTSYGVVPGTDKQVSIYIDGVYVGSSRGSMFDLPDIARIEVLRGPQGTLFGRNATAGAVSVVTRDPTGEAGASIVAHAASVIADLGVIMPRAYCNRQCAGLRFRTSRL